MDIYLLFDIIMTLFYQRTASAMLGPHTLIKNMPSLLPASLLSMSLKANTWAK